MNTSVLILVILFLILLVVGMSFYYFKLIKRVLLVLDKDINKYKKLYILLGIIFSLISINLFTTIGIFFMHFVVVSLFIDLIYWLIKRLVTKEWIVNIYRSCLIPLGLTLVILVYGFFNIRNIIEMKYTIYTDKVLEEDLRILFISDSHYGDILKSDRLEAVKERFDAVNADIVVLGGDIVDEGTSKEDMEYIFSVLGKINSKYGIYYVYGNHDRQQYRLDAYYSNEELEKTILENNIVIINDNYVNVTDNIVLLGREDYSFKRKKISEFNSDVDNNDYLIMIDHQPVKYAENVDEGIDLIMSGHTHGGQIFPIEFFINLLHTADLAYGYKNVEGMDAIVSSGLVGWGYPIRTSRNSEYVVIDIKEKK